MLIIISIRLVVQDANIMEETSEKSSEGANVSSRLSVLYVARYENTGAER
jgi:hypothetical protein